MNVIANVQTVPRAVVGGYLRAARLPLTAVERIAKQQDNMQWPPALTYESFEAGVETVVGSLLRDPVLVDKGRLRQAKIGQLRKSAELETVAAQEREQADERLAQERKQAVAERKEAERRAEQRQHDLDRQAELREQKVREKTAKKKAAVHAAEADQEKAIARRERVAKTSALSKETQALQTAKQALDAEQTVDVIAATLEGSKEARSSS